MRIVGYLALVSSLVLVAGCENPHPYSYTPDGQVISTGRNPADVALESNLRSELNRYGDLSSVAPNVQIYAQNGTVTLSGQVPSERDRQMVEALVRNSSGVTGVNDQLQVSYPPTGQVYSTPPGPVVTPPPVVTAPLTPGIRVQPTTRADEPIARHIVDRLRHNSIPPEWVRDVTITVTDGTAYLQGIVDNPEQRQAILTAVQSAHGVRAVYDQMRQR